jgi:hypothetical protein
MALSAYADYPTQDPALILHTNLAHLLLTLALDQELLYYQGLRGDVWKEVMQSNQFSISLQSVDDKLLKALRLTKVR